MGLVRRLGWWVLRWLGYDEWAEMRREIAPTTRREGHHVTILVGNKPLSPDFVPSHQSKSGRPL